METNYTTSPSTEQQQRDNFTQHGVAAYKLTTNNRAYAADQFAQSALGAVAKAWHEINIEGKGRTSCPARCLPATRQ